MNQPHQRTISQDEKSSNNLKMNSDYYDQPQRPGLLAQSSLGFMPENFKAKSLNGRALQQIFSMNFDRIPGVHSKSIYKLVKRKPLQGQQQLDEDCLPRGHAMYEGASHQRGRDPWTASSAGREVAQLDVFSEINPHSVATVHNALTGSSKVKVNKFNQIAMREFLESETHSKLQSETLNNLRNNLEIEQ